MLSSQLHIGHACSKITKIIQRKVHFLYAKNLPAELPGYGLVYPLVDVFYTVYVLFSLQPLKDVHLVMFVLVFLLVDLVILIICTALDNVRLSVHQVSDKEHGPELDVSVFFVC